MLLLGQQWDQIQGSILFHVLTKLIIYDVFFAPQLETADDDIYEVSIRSADGILVVPPISTKIGEVLEIDISHLPVEDGYYSLSYMAKSGNGNGGCIFAELVGRAAYYPGMSKEFLGCIGFNYLGVTFFRMQP